MHAEAQKLELIAWIAAIDDNNLLDKLSTVKKAFEPKKAAQKQAATNKALALLNEITAAYAASTEPDLNITQIFTDRTKTNGRKIDFN